MVYNENIELTAARLFEILKKFQPHLKTIEVQDLFGFSREGFFNLLNAASGVEKLTLSYFDFSTTAKRHLLQLKEFRNLKHLNIAYIPEIDSLFKAIPDDSLEVLLFNPQRHLEISDEILQAFLHRQRNIKTLGMSKQNDVNIDHLVLEQLRQELPVNSRHRNEDTWKPLLEKQPELRFLSVGLIEDDTFETICQLSKLESLRVSLEWIEDFSSIEKLNSLQNLKELALKNEVISQIGIWRGSRFLGQVKMPNLQKLSLDIADHLIPQLFTNMARGMENLQELVVCNSGRDFLRTIIGNFKTLKTLKVDVRSDAAWEASNTVPLCRNESLEVLEIRIKSLQPSQPLHDTINACPNLKSLILNGVNVLDASVWPQIPKNSHSSGSNGY